MFTKREYKLPEVPKLLEPTENEKRLHAHALELRKTVEGIFRSLNDPNMLVIDADAVESKTGTGSTFVMSASPTIAGVLTLPAYVLTSNGAANNNVYYSWKNAAGTFTSGTAGAWVIKAADNNFFIDNFEGATIFRGASYAEWARLNSTGLGIGMTPARTLDVTGTFRTNGGTSGAVEINATGQLYGTSLHNNSGAVTGTTNQYIASGTYTLSLTNVANAGFLGGNVAHWIRVGNVVTVSGSLTITPTAATTQTQVGISLPIASSLSNHYELAGTAISYTAGAANQAAAISADATNNRAQLEWYAPDTTSRPFYFVFSYVVL